MKTILFTSSRSYVTHGSEIKKASSVCKKRPAVFYEFQTGSPAFLILKGPVALRPILAE